MTDSTPTHSQSDTHRRILNGSSATSRATRPTQASRAREAGAKSKTNADSGLKDYQLGDCLGKGAFGAVYRGLNMGTGETVAIKQIKVADIPKSDLRVIMLEIDLLKNLNHPNIVKYQGSVKTAEALNIILEYCENGSLHSICKNFGKFPENLVALYMSQVLNGLLYLHEQGVIHRDIKGANILTTKEGLVKLADFGVATKTSGLHESSVVGTPYWMAPEVIELSGATTASDIWSLGCTVIELLDGKPPYHRLQPMPALFRIVNDDHPPLPDSISTSVTDFLMQCFQKDPNLRVSARKLLKHPWIVNAKRMDSIVPDEPTKYDVTVKTVQLWNDALKSPEGTLHRDSVGILPNQTTAQISKLTTPLHDSEPGKKRSMTTTDPFKSPEDLDKDNWDDDFASSVSPGALQLPVHLRPVDHFAGMLSSDKLKAYASAANGHPTQSTMGNSSKPETLQVDTSGVHQQDPLETVRAPSPEKTKTSKQKIDRNAKPVQRRTSQPKTQILRGIQQPSNKPVMKKQPPPSDPLARPKQPKRSSSVFREDPDEDYSDLVAEDDFTFDQKIDEIRKAKPNDPFSPTFPHVSDLKNASRSTKAKKGSNNRKRRPFESSEDEDGTVPRTRSSVEIQKYADKMEDEDFSDIFGADQTMLARPESESGSDRDPVSMLNSKFSSSSWLGDEEEEDDPFAQLEENLGDMDLESKVARDKYLRLCSLVENLIASMKTSQSDDYLAELSEQLMQVLLESPDMKSVVISSHGLLPILEVLDSCQRRDISLRLLKTINAIISDSVEIQETLCFVGGIPIVSKFAYKKYSSEIRLEAAAFIRQIYQSSTLTLQMFISCGGLNVLVEFLEEDYDSERDLVIIGVNGMWSVFELQGPTPKNDFCRIFSRSSALYPLSQVLNKVLDEDGELAELVQGRIVQIFLLFSQAENYVKESIADRMILKSVLKDLKRLQPHHQITMLKFIKNLSMLGTTLESLQNSNTIEVLADLLESSLKLPHGVEMSNQITSIMFNLCRLSKTRQEDAALNGVIPLLQGIAETEKPVKNFALPILCDMAHSGKVCRKILWQNKGLNFYIGLLKDPYWGGSALDAIFIWLQEEMAKVEEYLLYSSFPEAIVKCFMDAEKDAFENLLDPLQKLLRLSPPIAATLAHPQLLSRTVKKLNNKKAVVRGNLLRIIRSICDASDDQGGLIHENGLFDTIERLAEGDPAILVRNMASDLVRLSESNVHSLNGGPYHASRRASSVTVTPPSLMSSSSLPQTPAGNTRPSAQTTSYFDLPMEYAATRTRASNINGGGGNAYRPVSRDGPRMGIDISSNPNGTPMSPAAKSRLPRTNITGRLKHRASTSSRRGENMAGATSPSSSSSARAAPTVATPRSGVVPSPRKRPITSGGIN